MDFLDDSRGKIQAAPAAGGLAEVRVDRPRAAQARCSRAADVVVAVAVANTYVHAARMG